MKTDFDHIAKEYDTDFTHSEIGKRQRSLVYDCLDSLFQGNGKTKQNILELNCGTGEDAIWLSKKGNIVLATDISGEMIAIAKEKGKGIENLTVEQLDINEINSKFLGKDTNKFDLIFSNFGGLNCLSKQELVVFFNSASKFLTDNGKIIMTIMPKNCIWENKYLLFSGKWKQLFRRNTNDFLSVAVGDSIVKTWYYNPKGIVNLVNDTYSVKQIKPIGFYIPPSYLEPFFKNKIWMLNCLNWMEKRIKNWSFLARYSDHFIITIQKK